MRLPEIILPSARIVADAPICSISGERLQVRSFLTLRQAFVPMRAPRRCKSPTAPRPFADRRSPRAP